MDFQQSDEGRSSSTEPRLLTRREAVVSDAPERVPGWRERLFSRRSPASPEPRRERISHRTFFSTIGVLLLLAVAALFVVALVLRHSMTTSLPQIDGDVRVPGLTRSVTVVRDAHGVPSITAASLDDLLFAQGYVTAQDRLWQMDALRRHAAGELAEILGPSLVQHDRTQRVLQLRATADRAAASMDPAELHQLRSYANGVNAFLAQNASRLPVEFHLLHYTPAPWTPRDSILVSFAMAQDLSTVFPNKLLREAFSQHLPPELLADLYPVGSWRDHPPGAEKPDLTSPRPEVEQIPLDETQASTRTDRDLQQLVAVRDAFVPQACADCIAGSNNWALAGARSASGKPLVSNDMHLSLSVPDIWYSAALRVSDDSFNAAGVTLPGAPFIIVGRNAHVAWGFTAMLADAQDIFIEHVRGEGADKQYQTIDGAWLSPQHNHELIRVRGGTDVKLDVVTTQHRVGDSVIDAPVINPIYPNEKRSLSLLWPLYDTAHFHIPFLAADTAANGAALVAALSTISSPTLSLVYADDENHIGYHAIGRVPVRGPAVHHPRAMQEAAPATTTPDEENNEGAAVAPAVRRPLLTPASFVLRPVRRQGAARTARPAKPKQPAAPDVPALPPPRDYTIGSAIPPVPVDALDPHAQWSGYIPYDELPSALDPAEGVLATANARVTPDDYPYAVALDWAPANRVDRIVRVLTARHALTPADMLALEMDVHSDQDLAFAQRFAYAIDQANLPTADSARLRAAADILRRWNGEVTPDSAAFAIVASARSALWTMLIEPQIRMHDHLKTDAPVGGITRVYTGQQRTYALEQIMAHEPARWLPPGYTNWNQLLTAAVTRGFAVDKAPADLHTWSFSRLYPIEIAHPLLGSSFVTHLLGVTTGSGPRVVGGNGNTVKAVGHSFGPSERFTADLASPDALLLNITTGESGNPRSPWYLDQLPLWLGGQTLALRLGQPAEATHTLTLAP